MQLQGKEKNIALQWGDLCVCPYLQDAAPASLAQLRQGWKVG